MRLEPQRNAFPNLKVPPKDPILWRVDLDLKVDTILIGQVSDPSWFGARRKGRMLLNKVQKIRISDIESVVHLLVITPVDDKLDP